MGKKDKDKKKKGKGAEKTAEKTDKKLKTKMKKELAAKGEDDIESMVKAIEDEEKKRQEVKEISVGPPSHRSNFSLSAHPDNPEIVMFGGEFYNGQKTILNNQMLIYNTKRGEWTQVKSPAGPPPRSSHQEYASTISNLQAAIVSQGGGQLWIFGGEFVSPTESQFYHYKDLWCFHFASKRWEKVAAAGGPSSRSGHRMVVARKHLVVFGGFHDNLRECKYFNDLYAFDLEERRWKKLETVGSGPSPRSACQMFALPDGRVVVYGGYCKVKAKKDVEKGVTHGDMFVLSPDKHDDTLTKWRWQAVKQVGHKPSLRTGMCTAAARDRVFVFGGVQDKEVEGRDDDEDDDEDDDDGNFFNELYSLQIEAERATWHLVELTGKKEGTDKKKRRRGKEEDGEAGTQDDSGDEDSVAKMEALDIEGKEASGPTTVTVESGAFTVSSTIGEKDKPAGERAPEAASRDVFVPHPRFSAGLALKGSVLYLFGGLWEHGEKDFTLKDFYSLDTHKMDTWTTIVESDIDTMEWFGSSDEDEDESSEEEEDEMDTS